MTLDKKLIAVLKKNLVLHHLNEEQKILLLQHGKFIKFSKGAKILTQGMQGDGLYILVKGSAKVLINLLNKHDLKIAEIKVGSFFGEINLLTGKPCTTSIISKGEIIAFLVEKKVFSMLKIFSSATYYLLFLSLIENVVHRQHAIMKNIVNRINKYNLNKKNISLSKKVQSILFNNTLKEKLITQLLNSYFFSEFKREEITKFISICKIIKCPDKTILIPDNSLEKYAYLIIYGSVKIKIANTTLAVLWPNIFFSSVPTTNELVPLEYISCGETVLLKIEQSKLTLLKQQKDPLWNMIFELMGLHIVSLQLKLNTLQSRLNSENKKRRITHV